MDVKRAILIVSLGPGRAKNVQALLSNLKQVCPDIPVYIVTDHQRNLSDEITQLVVPHNELQWLDSPRWGVRNCNVLSARFALEPYADSYCVLNDDMRIVHSEFTDGFLLAERFGVCVPLNPRVYVKYNARGTDAGPKDFIPYNAHCGPPHAPACNVSPLFVYRLDERARILLSAYLEELQNCMRGTLAFWRASWKTGITPVYLPEQWCVGASSAKYMRDYKKRLQGKDISIECMMLHWGQRGVRDVFSKEGI